MREIRADADIVGVVARSKGTEVDATMNRSAHERLQRASGRTSLSWGRLAVVVMLGIEALYFTLVAFGNITDYYTNYAFLKGVMSMGDDLPRQRPHVAGGHERRSLPHSLYRDHRVGSGYSLSLLGGHRAGRPFVALVVFVRTS